MQYKQETELAHQELVERLQKSGHEILESLTPEKVSLLHMAVGIAGEAGELLDAVKKHVFYDAPLDVTNVVEELGDLEFYMEGTRQQLVVSTGLPIDRTTILTANYDKLTMRYGSGEYSDTQAQERADKK